MDKLKDGLFTKTGWEIIKDGFDKEQLITIGSNFMIGNGYLGYRGTLAEWGPEEYVGCIVSDTYDMADDKWRELCNAPNGLYTKVFIEGKELSVFNEDLINHNQQINLKKGLYNRKTTWNNEENIIKLSVEKFASYEDLHCLTMNYTFSVEEDAEVTLLTGINGEVWDLNGPHLKDYQLIKEDNLIAVDTVTVEKEIKLDVVEGINLSKEPSVEEIIKRDKKILRKLTFNLKGGEKVKLRKITAIYSSNDVDDPLTSGIEDVKKGLEKGYERLKKQHKEKWEEIWETSDIKLEGDLEAQTALRFNLYHNIICTPAHTDKLPIGARGLSCQAYQGAAFWDQEIFNMSMFLYTRPEITKNILKYRYHTLDGARKKAKDLGYYGAYYAWISGKTGEELCPDYFFENVLTGRKIRNHFNDWQIHISPDIAYAIWHYYQATGDWEFVVEYGAEMIFEIAQFLVSHAYFKKDKNRYEFIRVLGPDEYHENVDNNAFTNYQAQFTVDKAVTIYNKLKEQNSDKLEALFNKLELGREDVANWEEMAELIYLPQPDEDSLLIEQFDGYFDLEDVTPKEVEARLKDPHEYLGWPVGVAAKTQVMKQADVIQLFCLHDIFDRDVMKANYNYYEPRCEHGSSLSPSAYSIIASEIGYLEEAYDYFMKSCTVDLYNTNKAIHGGTFIGGIHTAACGAAWKMIVQGFAGLKITGEGLKFEPELPASWDKVKFYLCYRENSFQVIITKDKFIIESVDSSSKEVKVQVGENVQLISPGSKEEFAI